MNIHAVSLERQRRTFWQRTVKVFSAWLKAPTEVASICPSSRALVQSVADRDCISSAKAIVDLGPGTGGTTAAILQHADKDCRVLAIEKTGEFIEPLLSLDDQRLTIRQGDAIDLEQLLVTHQMGKPDVIVSGIPFSSISLDSAVSIMDAIYQNLADDGTFIAYQLRSDVARYAADYFGRPVSHQWVHWNVPPLQIFTWRKNTPQR